MKTYTYEVEYIKYDEVEIEAETENEAEEKLIHELWNEDYSDYTLIDIEEHENE